MNPTLPGTPAENAEISELEFEQFFFIDRMKIDTKKNFSSVESKFIMRVANICKKKNNSQVN